jgi:lipid-binding SYLF domain-containing protein
MKQQTRRPAACLALFAVLMGPASLVHANADRDTVDLFRDSRQSVNYFRSCYGYAVFPTIGKGGLGVGAAYGSGNVYAHGVLKGRVTMTQLSIGAQAGGEAYSEIIFFKNKDALENFTSGNFEFSADAGVTAITAAADVSVGTTGVDANASATENDAATMSRYNNGMAVFVIAKGGLMYHATIAGQKFSYTPESQG